jgi:hypothetical protein
LSSDGRGVQSKDLGLAYFRTFEENRGSQQIQPACFNPTLRGYKLYVSPHMKQRFLNQKLGKRTSHRAALTKAKALLKDSRSPSSPRPPKPCADS